MRAIFVGKFQMKRLPALVAALFVFAYSTAASAGFTIDERCAPTIPKSCPSTWLSADTKDVKVIDGNHLRVTVAPDNRLKGTGIVKLNGIAFLKNDDNQRAKENLKKWLALKDLEGKPPKFRCNPDDPDHYKYENGRTYDILVGSCDLAQVPFEIEIADATSPPDGTNCYLQKAKLGNKTFALSHALLALGIAYYSHSIHRPGALGYSEDRAKSGCCGIWIKQINPGVGDRCFPLPKYKQFDPPLSELKRTSE